MSENTTKDLIEVVKNDYYNFLQSDESIGDSFKNRKCDLCGIKNLTIERKNIFQDTEVCAHFLLCPVCKKYISVWVNGQWHSLESVLEEQGAEIKQGITEVSTPAEKVTVFILSQIHYNVNDMDISKEESPFLPFAEEEKVKLAWSERKVVGFYSVKLKGSLCQDNYNTYAMNIVDTIYVISSHRRKGFASLMLLDLILSYPNEYIGFAEPVSLALKTVLLKFLQQNKKLRDMFWSCSFTGEEGYRENLWFTLNS